MILHPIELIVLGEANKPISDSTIDLTMYVYRWTIVVCFRISIMLANNWDLDINELMRT